MKKSIFIITLVFTLLLSCSGGGLVAYAAYGDSISFYNDNVSISSVVLDEVSESGFSYEGVSYAYPDEILNFIKANSLDSFFVTRYVINDVSRIIFVFYKDDVTTVRYSNANGSSYTYDYIKFESSELFCDVSYNIGSDGLVVNSILDELSYYQINNYKMDDDYASVVCSETNLLDLSSRSIIYSNKDLIVEDGKFIGTCFFHLPQLVLGTEQQTLTQILNQENPLKEILLLLPMAMVCLVGYVALRKGLRILETILKTA